MLLRSKLVVQRIGAGVGVVDTKIDGAAGVDVGELLFHVCAMSRNISDPSMSSAVARQTLTSPLGKVGHLWCGRLFRLSGSHGTSLDRWRRSDINLGLRRL